MITFHTGDIFEAPIDILAHACNPKGIWGGLAGKVKEFYPEAHEADALASKKLGSGILIPASKRNGSMIKYIANLYTQPDISSTFRMTNYEAVINSFEWLYKNIPNRKLVIGIPYLFASDKGGAYWPIVFEMLRSVFDYSETNVIICKLNNSQAIKKALPTYNKL